MAHGLRPFDNESIATVACERLIHPNIIVRRTSPGEAGAVQGSRFSPNSVYRLPSPRLDLGHFAVADMSALQTLTVSVCMRRSSVLCESRLSTFSFTNTIWEGLLTRAALARAPRVRVNCEGRPPG